MVKKSILLIFLILISFSFISAQEIRFNGEQNTILNVTDTCSFNDLPCPSAFKCNITIEDPSQNILVNDQLMDRTGNVYNYTLDTTQTNALGIYEVKQIYCTDGNNNGTSSFNFRITVTGAEPIDTGQGLTILGTFIVLIVATLFFLVFGILTKNIPFKIFFVSLSLLFMFSTVGFSVATMQQVFATFGSLVTAYGRFYILLSILLTAGGIGLFIYLIVIALKSFDSTRNFFKNNDD